MMQPLISEEYRALQSQLHEEREDYGTASLHFAPMISDLINKTQAKEMLDYGAGKCRLSTALRLDHKIKLYAYEPAIFEMSKTPEPRELVCCIDVLEHIEPDKLDSVLDDLKRVTIGLGVYTVSTIPAQKELADGRNAHLIIEPMEWWLPKFLERFKIHSFTDIGNGFVIMVKPK